MFIYQIQMKRNQDEAIKSMQQDENYVVLSNPLASPKFIRMIGKGKEIAINDTYTPKIFIEIASQLTPEHLEGLDRSQTIKLNINIREFLQNIGANIKNYKHLIDSIEIMQSNILKWREGNEVITTAIINKAVHNEKTGKVEIFVDSDIARHILEVKRNSNFHFLKSNIFRLQNAQAIRLYPFFKSWENYEKGYETSLERFKEQFGYNTKGYIKFSNFDVKVLKSATEEINEKTDILVTYETTGENLDGLRPRVTGLIFWVKSKEKVKVLSNEEPKQEQTNPTPKAIETKQPRQEQEQPQTAQPKTAAPQDTTNLEPIYKAWKKLNFVDKDLSQIQEAFIRGLVKEKGFEAVYDAVLGLGQSKTIIKSLAIFYDDKTYLANRGKAEQAQKKLQEQEQKQKEQEIKSYLNNDYQTRKNQRLTEAFEQLSEEEKLMYYDEFLGENQLINGKFPYNRFIDLKQRGSFLKLGIEQIASKILEQNGNSQAQRQAKYREWAYNQFNVQIEFNERDEVTIITLFSNPTEVIETKPIEPQQQTIEPLPTPIEDTTEPVIEDDHKSRHQIKGLSSKDVQDMQKVETPKGFSNFIEDWKNKASNLYHKKISKK